MDIFKTLGNENRAKMLKALMKKSLHITALARELGISAPVALRHARILEAAGFIERQKVGSSHVLKINESAAPRIRKAWVLFEKPFTLQVKKGTPMIEVLKKVSGIKFENSKKGAVISEVDGKKGYYLYEVDGRLPSESVSEFFVSKNSTVELKLLQPVIGKKIIVKVI
ncbi:MAG TPA: winged helix-turn-helix transcriptional regulator [Candidatus Diapherotrites archaeon]|uniref:Winged helix-turn-helix transcriptional regulator n=1 Tax=Candidatus Iainarchaeum sp. TaxID=3101447 RepID=A0A7J4KSI9_9ARCH|nr:winged helix-turn-helix transcriptional regulator [Candidatus Diapherotrites archaeon]